MDRSPAGEPDVPSSDSLVTAFEQAWERRLDLHEQAAEMEAYRLMDGLYEGAPGWTLDRYGEAVLVQNFQPEGASQAPLEALTTTLRARLGSDIDIFLKERSLRDRERAVGRQIAGRGSAHRVVEESGLRFAVDFTYGLNTGLFLDARPMRRWVRENSSGSRILNLFSYTASFGVAAAAGEARSVTNVDVIPSALERGRQNFELNGLPADSRTHLRSEVFEFLRRAAKQERVWDGIIVDPPPVSTVGTRRGRRGRKRGFDPAADLQRVLERSAARVKEGGWLLALSAIRGRDRFEEQLPGGSWMPIARAPDFPGPPEEGLRGWVLERRS
ncbi:MAG: class I SAM-dependent methyltransferase [Myxococcota bacterium]|nr:class I SAM-dependent methyltransferase [Myxococcota bacterium]